AFGRFGGVNRGVGGGIDHHRAAAAPPGVLGQLTHGGDDLPRARHVQLGTAGRADIGTRLLCLPVQLSSQLPGPARDQQRQRRHSSSPARLRNGSHQLRLSLYQRTVSAKPSVNGTAGRYPNSVLIVVMSTEYLRSWPLRSGTYSTMSQSAPTASSNRPVSSLLVSSVPPPML